MDERLIVVTGGAGFIGSCLIKHLNDLKFTNIVVVDELGGSDKWSNLVGKQFVEILDKSQLFSWLEGRQNEIQAFVHLGACSDTMEKDASYLLENNYRYTVKLAEWATTYNIRFIYASSAATYGDGAFGFSDDHTSIPSLLPLNMYGYSKHLVDLWALNEGVLKQCTGLKFFNVFGPNEAHKGRMASAITRMVPQILKEGKVQLFKSSQPALFADGEQKRDFLYVKDAVRFVYQFLSNQAVGIYNIGSSEASTWNELARAVFLALNKPVNIEYIDMPTELVAKYQNYSCADMRKTMKTVGKSEKCFTLKKAVKEYVQDYLIPEKKW